MSSSIFSKIIRLSQGDKQRTEDVFTEIFNVFLNSQKDISWLLEIFGLDYLEIGDVTSSTQVHLGRLEPQDSASKPDIVIETLNSIIFVESKIDCQEGPDQLPRYYAHLKNRKETTKILLYITKNYDPKDIKDDEQKRIKFRQTTWSKVYFALKSKKFTPKPGVKYYLNEMLTFMEEMDMAQPKLEIENLIALKHYKSTTKFIQEIENYVINILRNYKDKKAETFWFGTNYMAECIFEHYLCTLKDKTIFDLAVLFNLKIEDKNPIFQFIYETKSQPTVEMLKDKLKNSALWTEESNGAEYCFRKELSVGQYFDQENQIDIIKNFFKRNYDEAVDILDDL